ncbi:MAG: hypothetical protein RDU83_13860 [bacterium]|nr:hypothetical protein [bacterium]
MPHYQKDADLVARLGERIGALGMPLLVTRKFNGIVNAITMQVEDEYASPQVVDTLFVALLQLAGHLREPESGMVAGAVQEYREQTAKRLLKRGDRTSAST